MIANMRAESSDIKVISENISRLGWMDSSDLFAADLLDELFLEACDHDASRSLSMAAVGNNAVREISSIRGDSTLWLDDPRCGTASKNFLAALDVLRKQLNQSLMLGLESVEAHFAIYPAGMGYGRHRDRFRDDDARVLSMICYLNTDWPADAGGELRLYLTDGDHDIAPRIGTSVIFLSAEIEHEVLLASRTRYSIAVWFRRQEMQVR